MSKLKEKSESVVVSSVLNVQHIHVNIFSLLFLAKRTLDFSIIYYWLFSVFHSKFTLARSLTHQQSHTIILQHSWTTAAWFFLLCYTLLFMYIVCFAYYILLLLLFFKHTTQWRNERKLKKLLLLALLCCIDRNS